MGVQLPIDLWVEVIHQVEAQSDLYNCCLVSKTFSNIATACLYSNIHDINTYKYPIEKQLQSLQSLSKLSGNSLNYATKFYIGTALSKLFYKNWRYSEYLRREIIEAVLACMAKMHNLKTFQWLSYTAIHSRVLTTLLQINNITNLQLLLPPLSERYQFADNKVLEAQIFQFQNLESFQVYGLWTPNLKTIKGIARVLLNSPKLRNLGISLSIGRCEAWMIGQSVDENEIYEEDLERNDEEHDIDFLLFFPILCQEYAASTADMYNDTSQTRASSTKVKPLLSLRRLNAGPLCLVTKDVELLTDLSVLEHLSIHNGMERFLQYTSPYECASLPSPMLCLAGVTPKLKSMRFENFKPEVKGVNGSVFDEDGDEDDAETEDDMDVWRHAYSVLHWDDRHFRCTAPDINFSRDFPHLTELIIERPRKELIQEITKCGGGGVNATRWKKLALGNHYHQGRSSDVEITLTNWVAKCEQLTHLYIHVDPDSMATLLSTISKLPCLQELYVTAYGLPLESRELWAEQIFAANPNLQVAGIWPRQPQNGSKERFWRRSGGEITVISISEVDVLNRDEFPRSENKMNYLGD